MQRFNWTIKQKHCKCSPDCDKWPTLGYGGYNSAHVPNELKEENPEKYKKKAVHIRKQSIKSQLARKLHEVDDKVNGKSIEPLKSALLKLADTLFGNFIKGRDSDNNGNISCVCCGKIYNLEDKDSNGDKVVQPLHFVSRTIYTQRWNENQVYAGCCYCNKDMHDFPDGIAYRQFRNKLCIDLGYEVVSDIEDEKYNVNRISHSDIQNIIEKYKHKK